MIGNQNIKMHKSKLFNYSEYPKNLWCDRTLREPSPIWMLLMCVCLCVCTATWMCECVWEHMHSRACAWMQAVAFIVYFHIYECFHTKSPLCLPSLTLRIVALFSLLSSISPCVAVVFWSHAQQGPTVHHRKCGGEWACPDARLPQSRARWPRLPSTPRPCSGLLWTALKTKNTCCAL